MEKLTELRGEIEERRKRLHEVFEQAGPDMDMSKVTVIDGDSTAKVESVRAINDELDDLVKKAEPLEKEQADLQRAKRAAAELGEIQNPMQHPAPAKGGSEPKQKSLGELFVESKAGTELKGHEVAIPDVDVKALLKTTFETTAGWAPETTRTGRLVEAATRPIQIIDLIPGGSTSQSAVVYMEETTFTNSAAETAEAGAYPESALALTEKSSTVRKVATWLPVTDEQLEDVPQAEGYVNRRLPFMLRQRLDSQIVVGNGTAPNLRGFLNVVGIQTQAKGADPTPDAVYKAMTKVRVTGRALPGAVIFHPNDWQDIRLLRTADGIYVWGNPSEAGPERIWGLPVVQSDAITENTALVGDYANYSELALRRGIEVKVSDSHSDFFVNGKQAIRADLRAALVAYRPAAFCTVTGI
jgi:HK97 family phage major capsid protein